MNTETKPEQSMLRDDVAWIDELGFEPESDCPKCNEEDDIASVGICLNDRIYECGNCCHVWTVNAHAFSGPRLHKTRAEKQTLNTQQNPKEPNGDAPLDRLVMGWIDVNDSLPDFDINVLAIMNSGSICVLSRCDENGGWLWACAEQGHDLRNADTFTDDVYEPSHWMPFPEDP